MLKGWILYNKTDYQKNYQFAQRFIEKADIINAEIKLIFRDDLISGIKDNQLFVNVNDTVSDYPDFVINRSRDGFIGKQFELMKIKVYNSSFISEVCNDKARTHQLISQLGIPCVNTIFCSKDLKTDFDKLGLKYPIVLKSVDGHGGNEVFKVEDSNEAPGYINSLKGNEFLLQDMCPKPGRDIRVFVIGKEIIAAILRSSKDDFRANYSLGGDISLYTLSECERKLVNKIVDHFSFGFVGIDFIFDNEGSFLFNEIEDSVGSRSLSIKSSIDVVDIYLRYIEKDLKGWL